MWTRAHLLNFIYSVFTCRIVDVLRTPWDKFSFILVKKPLIFVKGRALRIFRNIFIS